MAWITENDKRFWMPDILPEPTEEYQQEQSEKFYLTDEGKERRHPGWTYADNTAYVDDEYLFQNEGWKLVVDEVPVEPVTNKVHQNRNTPNLWEEIDERTVGVTYSISGFIPEVLPKLTEEYQQEQLEKRYLTPEDIEVNHPRLSYSLTGAYVDDEYLFQNEGWRLIVDEVAVEPITNKVHQTRNTSDQWEEIDAKTVEVTYSISGFIPTVLPEATQTYQQEQLEKKYLTSDDIEVNHPKWSYVETGAYVDDEYLFQNEEWKLIVDEVPNEPVLGNTHYTRNTPDLWEEIDEKTVEVTYTFIGWVPSVFPEQTNIHQQTQSENIYINENGEKVYHPRWSYVETGAYVDDEYLFQNEGWKVVIDDGGPDDYLKHKERNSHINWEHNDERTVKVTYTITDFTEEEIEVFKENKWSYLRDKRDSLLGATDWIIVRAMEENLVVSDEVTTYRQQLRDFPATITDILDFNIEDDTLWPTKPEVYFEV